MMKFEFGVTVRDVVTGVSGVNTGFCSYITGCNQYLVQPVCKKDKTKKPDPLWIDEDRLEEVKAKKVILKKKEHPGCDLAAPVK